MNWKAELAAIVGARHGGQAQAVLQRLQDLDTRYPQNGEINYQIAWSLDVLGRSAEAIAYYEKAVALSLPPNELSGALLGLGSSLRVSGQFARSAEVLESGRRQFPDHREFEVFLAITLHRLGRHDESLRLLLLALADTSEDPGITAYGRVIRYYATQLSAETP